MSLRRCFSRAYRSRRPPLALLPRLPHIIRPPWAIPPGGRQRPQIFQGLTPPLLPARLALRLGPHLGQHPLHLGDAPRLARIGETAFRTGRRGTAGETALALQLRPLRRDFRRNGWGWRVAFLPSAPWSRLPDLLAPPRLVLEAAKLGLSLVSEAGGLWLAGLAAVFGVRIRRVPPSSDPSYPQKANFLEQNWVRYPFYPFFPRPLCFHDPFCIHS